MEPSRGAVRLDEFERFEEQQAREGNMQPNHAGEATQTNLMTTVQALLEQNARMLNMLQLNSERRNESPPVKNFSIMPDLSKTIDRFDGEKGSRSAKLWLQQIENTASLHDWPDAFIFQTAKSHLEGAAKFWLTGRSDDIFDWKTFREAFMKTFIFEKNKTDLWKKMIERVQQPRESIALYFHEKVALCRELDLRFKETKEQVIIGLFSRDMSNFLLSKEHYDEDQLFQDILEYERVSNSRRGRVQIKRDERTSERSKEVNKKEKTVIHRETSWKIKREMFQLLRVWTLYYQLPEDEAC